MYTPWSVTAGEVPTTAKWNILGDNDESFNDGTGIADNVILARHIPDGELTSEKKAFSIGCKAYRSSAFNITTSEVKLTLNAEVHDPGADFDTTNGRFVAPLTGYYRVSVSVGTSSVGASTRFGVVIYVNGVSYARGVAYGVTAGGTPTANVSDVVYLTAGQYIEMYIEGSTTITGSPSADRTFMSVGYLGE